MKKAFDCWSVMAIAFRTARLPADRIIAPFLIPQTSTRFSSALTMLRRPSSNLPMKATPSVFLSLNPPAFQVKKRPAPMPLGYGYKREAKKNPGRF